MLNLQMVLSYFFNLNSLFPKLTHLLILNLFYYLESLGLQGVKPVNSKAINSEYSLEGLMLKLQLQYFDHLMWRANSLEKIRLIRKDPDAGKDWRQEEKGAAEDEMG